MRWLDVGCGIGKMGSIAFENITLEKFVFCDCSDGMIKIVKERFNFQNAEFSVCDVQELDYANEFDVITAIQVNHYFNKSSRKIALTKYYTALKNNGLFISFENFAHLLIWENLFIWKSGKDTKLNKGIVLMRVINI